MVLSSPKIKICAGILAGGIAGRIGGIIKGLIDTGDGLTIIDGLCGEMAKAGIDEIVLSAIDASPYEGLSFEVVTDLGDRIGPIGGVEAVLRHFSGKCDAVLLMPCDVPNITVREISILIERFVFDEALVVVPRTGVGHFHPLCALVRDGVAALVSGAIKTGERKVMNVWRGNSVSIVDFKDESIFYNINTHADLHKWSAVNGFGLSDKAVKK